MAMTTDPGRAGRPRRRHPAQGARIAVTWAAATAVLAITAALGFAGRSAASSSDGTATGTATTGTSPSTTSTPDDQSSPFQLVPRATPAPNVGSGPAAGVTHGSH